MFFYRSVRWKGINEETLHKIKGPKIIAFWHGRQLMMPFLCLRVFPKNERNIVTLISQHSDGRIIARAIEKLGLRSIAGSSTRGGAKAFKELKTKIDQGYHVAITPDGPKGPANKVKPGVVQLALQSGATVVPVAYSAHSKWKLSSWDSMIVPKPFTRGVYAIGDPLEIPKQASESELEKFSARIETSLNEITEIADQHVA